MRRKCFQILLCLTMASTFCLCGCQRNLYVVPNALVTPYPAKAPMTVGVLIEPDVRQTWFKWNSENTRKRIDVPVGKLALDFARTGMYEAFEDFYIERYHDRRSEKGLLVVIDKLQFDLKREEVLLTVDVHIEDENSKEIFKKKYKLWSDEAKAGLGIPFFSKKPQTALEENTAIVFQQLYKHIVLDIFVLKGFVTVESEVEVPEKTEAIADGTTVEKGVEKIEKVVTKEVPKTGE